MTDSKASHWLALLHQLPTKPPYLRVKIWRRLQAIGAVPLKNAVHILPPSANNEATLRDLLDEIIGSGGEAILLDGQLLAGQSDADIRASFDAARNADYAEIAQAARRLLDTGPAGGADIEKLQKRLTDIRAIDFFEAHGREKAAAMLAELDRQRYRHPDVSRAEPLPVDQPIDMLGKTWVTRSGIHVDRIACAWLVRRFIDPKANFRFVEGRSCAAAAGELRFDMADAEFTHEGDRCSFETLMLRAGLDGDAALVAVAEMIHDLDIADGKFGRPETSGLGAMLTGICASTDDDFQRIAQGGSVLDQFHAFFSVKGTTR